MICLNCMKQFDEKYGVCPYCGFIPGTPQKEAYHLMPGVILKKRYVIGTTVGFGGFGITYRAWDLVLEKKVAVKEYYPNGIVNRIPGQRSVIIYSGSRENEFRAGKARFLAEARNMAKFSTHPNIVNVHEFFEENNTAYIVMEFLEGTSYKQYLKEHGGKIAADTAVKVALSVLDALKEIHKGKIVHRDVSPDNIFIIPSETEPGKFRVKLIDFGAARFSAGEEEKTLSIILKPGYAPPEQYRNKSRQGPWTDIYAVGAVLYFSITGVMPEESVNRMVEDRLKAPKELDARIPQYLNDTILRAMALNQELRFQNVDQFRAALENRNHVRAVEEELSHRKQLRGLRIGMLCAVLGGIMLLSSGFYLFQRHRLYGVEAEVVVKMPDRNREKNQELDDAGKLNTTDSEEVARTRLGASDEMLEKMLQEYREKFEKVSLTSRAEEEERDYEKNLREELLSGQAPAVFESSSIRTSDSEAWSALGIMETTYDRLKPEDYYFMETEEFQNSFMKEKKQIPIAFSAPVLYVNINLVSEEQLENLGRITSLSQLTDQSGRESYCVSSEYREMYSKAFSEGVKLADLPEQPEKSRGYEPFLSREKAFYLGSTDDYEAVRVGLGGIYRMAVLEELQKNGKVKGRFTSLWSISGNLNAEEEQAADSLVYYLMGENAQDIFNIQYGNGLPVNRDMMKIYVESNDEFELVYEMADELSMEYGEE